MLASFPTDFFVLLSPSITPRHLLTAPYGHELPPPLPFLNPPTPHLQTLVRQHLPKRQTKLPPTTDPLCGPGSLAVNMTSH
jgi:hypothetical protein